MRQFKKLFLFSKALEMEVMMLLTLFFLINSSICSESGESQNVLSRLSTVEHVLSTLLMEMEELRFDNRKLLMANEELRYNMNITQSHLSFTEEALRHAECDIHNLKKTNSIEGQQTNQVETQHDDQVDELSNLPVNGISDGKLQDGRLIKRDFTTQNPGTSKRAIAFSAHLRDSTSGLGDGQVIKFDIITTNEGNAYDASTGYFTCPQNGTYFFTSTLTSTYRAEFQGELVYNDRQQAVVYVAGSLGSHGHDQGANSVILNCIRGQHVCMRSVHDHRGNVYGGVYSTFSGFLL